MTDSIQKQLTDLTIMVGRMNTGVDDIKRLQADVVDLLRKHDRTDGRLDHLADLVAKHEEELQNLRAERISTQARRDYLRWWVSNWKNVALLAAIAASGLLFIFPGVKNMMGG